MIPLLPVTAAATPVPRSTKSHAAFVLPVLDRWLVVAPGHGVTALVNGAAAQALRSGTGRNVHALASLLDELRQRPNLPQPLEGEPSPSFLGILPTRGCNLACVYCNFGGPTADKVLMEPAIATSAVDWMADRLVKAGRRDFRIHFFGGEPFIAPEIVDIVVHRARSLAARHDLDLYVDASTNGVFNENRREFIGDYFSGVLLSFDGPAEFHDRNRPAFQGKPSFDIVNRTAKLLSAMPIDLNLRVCITEDSVGEMENITRWMIQDFKPLVVNFESLTPGALAQRAGLRVPDPYRFAAHTVGAYRVAASLGARAVYSAAESERTRLSFCPVGTDSFIVSPDGRASACYLMPEDWTDRGLDMDVGRVFADGRVAIDQAALARTRVLPMQKPRCERCFCQWTCAGGCHVNQTYPGCGQDYTDFCIQTRLITACLFLMELGHDDLVDALLADRGAMERLAHHDWDPIDIGEYAAAPNAAPARSRDANRPRSLVAEGVSLLG